MSRVTSRSMSSASITVMVAATSPRARSVRVPTAVITSNGRSDSVAGDVSVSVACACAKAAALDSSSAQTKDCDRIEAGVTDGWWRFVGVDGRVIGIDRFGASAPANELFEHFGFSVDNVVEVAKDVLN